MTKVAVNPRIPTPYKIRPFMLCPRRGVCCALVCSDISRFLGNLLVDLPSYDYDFLLPGRLVYNEKNRSASWLSLEMNAWKTRRRVLETGCSIHFFFLPELGQSGTVYSIYEIYLASVSVVGDLLCPTPDYYTATWEQLSDSAGSIAIAHLWQFSRWMSCLK